MVIHACCTCTRHTRFHKSLKLTIAKIRQPGRFHTYSVLRDEITGKRQSAAFRLGLSSGSCFPCKCSAARPPAPGTESLGKDSRTGLSALLLHFSPACSSSHWASSGLATPQVVAPVLGSIQEDGFLLSVRQWCISECPSANPTPLPRLW